ncbi:hypothetical protein T310_9575 [Rasamsonia emersonii CBS 393.64]|uniref:Uncharacterized protein n=1 Tax=Rasamsonia emersonii (strain ATCC 16479 / CBS 393.64 / IMI 116815) TaxID=1408163 RepID=A0A0F4YGV0_RASE3|nr:hypothetical protein T310_9575 [Rasamsonia emersonii CBS 393.64]KKA16858.1 hypothetical protein T310_9575 [Rasamsonia emersonii CBS 393.64]
MALRHELVRQHPGLCAPCLDNPGPSGRGDAQCRHLHGQLPRVQLRVGTDLKVVRALANAFLLRTTEEGSRSLVSGTTFGEQSYGRLWADDELIPAASVLLGKEGYEFRQKELHVYISAHRQNQKH